MGQGNGAADSKIRLRGVTKSFGDNHALRGVDLDVADGGSLVLFGTSGSGKTLLLKCILGIVHPDAGAIEIDGRDTVTLAGRARTAFMDRFSMLFQQGGLFDSLPIWENIAFKLINYRHMDRAEAREIALQKLTAVGLGREVGELYPAELSGGMQKRVGIARAIASEPEVVFLDEPTAGLDPIMSNRINDLILDLVQSAGTTAISITSDMNSARRIADRAAMIHEGRIIWTGATTELEDSGNEAVHQFVHKLAKGPIRMRVHARDIAGTKLDAGSP